MSRTLRHILACSCLAACGAPAEQPADPAAAVAPAQKSAAAAPHPSIEIVLEEGNVLHFFLEDDGVAVNEYGVPGRPLVTLQPELAQASPAEVFWAVTRAGAPVPRPLFAAHAGAVPATAGPPLSARPRGWLLDGELSARGDAETEVVCNGSALAFCGDPAQYNSYYCALNTTSQQYRYRTRVERYRAAFCIQAGGGLGDRLVRLTHANGVCNPPSGPTDIWNHANLAVGTAATHTWQRAPGGTYRAYEHFTYAFYQDTLDWAASAQVYNSCISP